MWFPCCHYEGGPRAHPRVWVLHAGAPHPAPPAALAPTQRRFLDSTVVGVPQDKPLPTHPAPRPSFFSEELKGQVQEVRGSGQEAGIFPSHSFFGALLLPENPIFCLGFKSVKTKAKKPKRETFCG